MDVRQILAELRAEQSRITQAIAALEAISTDGMKRPVMASPKTQRRGRMGAAARKHLSELMKRRWAQGKMKRIANTGSPDGRKRSVSAAPKGRRRGRMSAAARKRLSELMKKRWAQGKMKRRAKAA